MSVVAWVVLGALAGWLADAVFAGREGLVGTVGLAVIGSLVAGLASSELLGGTLDRPTVGGLVIAAAGALAVLAAWRIFAPHARGHGRLRL
jgi:uncharacterized membrane protein YeaQ/YmgE (transglycosylase-associated protein family)